MIIGTVIIIDVNGDLMLVYGSVNGSDCEITIIIIYLHNIK